MHQNVICNCVSSSHKKERTGYDELMSLPVKDAADRLVDSAVANIAKSTGENKIAGKKRHQYTVSFKASAINLYENGISQEEAAEKFCVTQSQVSRWIIKKKT